MMEDDCLSSSVRMTAAEKLWANTPNNLSVVDKMNWEAVDNRSL